MLWQQENIYQKSHLGAATIYLPAALILLWVNNGNCVVFTRGGSFGYLAAVAMPLDLPNRNVYMAFNFESNYGLPANDTYRDWVDRWDIDEQFVGIGNNVTYVDSARKKRSPARPPYDRRSFYRTFTGYLDHFGMNGSACLLRSICEVSASTLHVNNGVLGSLFKILFLPTTSQSEPSPLHQNIADNELYRAEWQGQKYMLDSKKNNNNYISGEYWYNEDELTANACADYMDGCPEGVINMISSWY